PFPYTTLFRSSDHGGEFRGWNHNAELAVEALIAGLARFGNVPRFACGHSFGGVLTSLIVSAHPVLFERAVLLDPVLFPPKLILLRGLLGWAIRNPMADGARKRRSHWQDLEEAFARLKGRGILLGWEDEAMWSHIEHVLRDDPYIGDTMKWQTSRADDIYRLHTVCYL